MSRFWIAFPLAVYFLIAMVGHLFGTPKDSVLDARPRVTRDSVQEAWTSSVVKHDTFVRFVRVASADTLGAILRDRARRPPLFVRDTVWIDTMTTAEDVGSSQQCEVAISCQEARRLIVRDSASMLLIDSLRGAITISKAERDSLDMACRPRSSWTSLGIGFISGLAVCAVIR